MCRKNVILFNCGHTRKLSITPCNNAGIECANLERILIPEGGGIGIEAPKDKVHWTCAFKCVPGRAAHEPLIDLAKENADAVKAEIDHKIEVLSVLSTPFGTPASEKGGFNFVKNQPSKESATPSPDAREHTTSNFKLTMPGDKIKNGTAKKEEAKALPSAQVQPGSSASLPSAFDIGHSPFYRTRNMRLVYLRPRTSDCIQTIGWRHFAAFNEGGTRAVLLTILSLVFRLH